MKKMIIAAVFVAMTTPAFAGAQAQVPEMSGGAGIAATALLAGLAAIIREKTTRK